MIRFMFACFVMVVAMVGLGFVAIGGMCRLGLSWLKRQVFSMFYVSTKLIESYDTDRRLKRARQRGLRLFPLFIVALACIGCSTGYTLSGIPNLAVVGPGLYRGGQPTDQGWRYLHNIGVSNVVKLNLESQASDKPAEQLGMTVYRRPLNTAQQLGLEKIPPYFFEATTTLMMLPGTFVHCEHGQDRTGLAVAFYRLDVQHRTVADAEKEMLDKGFHKSLVGLWEFWQSNKPKWGPPYTGKEGWRP